MNDRPFDPIAIDVGKLAERSVASLCSYLVTRPTGRAVRHAIERQLHGAGDISVSLIDLSEVRIIDFSCADEVVAKLLAQYVATDRPRDAFFVLRGVGDRHRGAIEAVLSRRDLAAVGETGQGAFELLGAKTDDESEVWSLLERAGRVSHREVEVSLGDSSRATALRSLVDRRLIYHAERTEEYHALSRLVQDLM